MLALGAAQRLCPPPSPTEAAAVPGPHTEADAHTDPHAEAASSLRATTGVHEQQQQQQQPPAAPSVHGSTGEGSKKGGAGAGEVEGKEVTARRQGAGNGGLQRGSSTSIEYSSSSSSSSARKGACLFEEEARVLLQATQAWLPKMKPSFVARVIWGSGTLGCSPSAEWMQVRVREVRCTVYWVVLD